MEDKETGGPAFPLAGSWRAEDTNGMTLRDYFAAKAMQSILSIKLPEYEVQTASQYAYAVADAMLAARSK